MEAPELSLRRIMQRFNHRSRLARRGVMLALLLSLPTTGAAQGGVEPLPYAIGEVLSYRAISSRFGTIGTGTMRVEGPESLRGYETMRLAFDFDGKVGPFRVHDRTRSWFVPADMMSIRYEKDERSPLGRRSESIEVYPDEERWTRGGAEGGRTGTATPLDELSFLYHIRCLPLTDGATYQLTRHFDTARNPISIRVLRREVTEVPAGSFATVVVDMKVKDSRFGGSGTLVLYLTDDRVRVPVRIESSMPWVGATRMVLESARGARLTAR